MDNKVVIYTAGGYYLGRIRFDTAPIPGDVLSLTGESANWEVVRRFFSHDGDIEKIIVRPYIEESGW